MKNEGKLFESDFINSVPKNIFKFRFRDFPYHLVKNCKYEVNNNPADFMIFKDKLYILELKSTKQSAYPFKNTRKNQVDGLYKYSKKDKVVCGFIFNMRKYNETYFMDIETYKKLEVEERKSIPITTMRMLGTRVFQELKRTRYSYDVVSLLNRI